MLNGMRNNALSVLIMANFDIFILDFKKLPRSDPGTAGNRVGTAVKSLEPANSVTRKSK